MQTTYRMQADEHGRYPQAMALERTTVVSAGAVSVTEKLPGWTTTDSIDDYKATRHAVRGYASAPVYLAFGDSTVTASSSNATFDTGTETMRIPDEATHFAVLSVDGSAARFELTRLV